MASSTNITYKNAVTTAISGPLNTDSVSLPQGSNQFYAFLKAANAVGSTVTAIIQHSPNGVDWIDGPTLTTAGNNVDSDNTIQYYFINTRARITVAGAPADVTVQLWYDPAC